MNLGFDKLMRQSSLTEMHHPLISPVTLLLAAPNLKRYFLSLPLCLFPFPCCALWFAFKYLWGWNYLCVLYITEDLGGPLAPALANVE